MATNIGGFFASLKMEPDKQSFDKSDKQLNNIRESIKKTGAEFTSFVGNAIKGLIAIGTAAVGAAGALSMIQAKSSVTAQRANLGASEYINFSKAIQIAGGNADEFIQSMSKMQETFDNLSANKSSQAYTEMAQNLALLQKDTGVNLTIEQLQKMTQKERAFALARAGEQTNFNTSQGRQALNIIDMIIPGMSNNLISNRQAGTNFAATYNEANALRATGANTFQESTQNARQLRKLGATGEEIFGSGLEKILTQLRPTIEKIQAYLQKHEKDFDTFFTNIGKLIEMLSKALGPIIEGVGGAIGDIVDTSVKTHEEFSSLKNIEKNPELNNKLDRFIDKEGYSGIFSAHGNVKSYAADIYSRGSEYAANVSNKDLSASLSEKGYHIGSIINNVALDEGAMKLAIGYQRTHKNAKWDEVIAAALAVENFSGKR